MKKLYYSDQQIKGWTLNIVRQMIKDHWHPDYVVGLTRGGLVPANLLSQYFDCRMETLTVRLRDHAANGCESNLWMAEDALGYGCDKKNILIVDDINDSGATLNWIKQDWPSGCLPDDPEWADVWNNNVRFAVIVNNNSSEFKDIDYAGTTINKADDPVWIVFPWESWWTGEDK